MTECSDCICRCRHLPVSGARMCRSDAVSHYNAGDKQGFQSHIELEALLAADCSP